MNKIFNEFKEFAVKGNAMELATAVVIGSAFGKIITSLVADIIMPLASLLIGGNFSAWKITLRSAVGSKPPIDLNIGIFTQNIVDFLIIAFSIFIMIKLLARLKSRLIKSKAEAEQIIPEPAPTKEQLLLTEIRDLLKK